MFWSHSKNLKHDQSGSVFFYVILFVSIFAMVSFALTQSGRDTSDMTREKSILDGATLAQYGTDIASAINTLMTNNIDPVDIDFVEPDDAGFQTAPHTAKVFHPGGGGVGYQQNTGGLAAFTYSKTAEIEDIGVAGAVDYLFVAEVTYNTCRMINLLHTKSDSIPDMDSTVFGNLLSGTADVVDAAACASCVGEKFFCAKRSGSNQFLYYHVVLDQ